MGGHTEKAGLSLFADFLEDLDAHLDFTVGVAIHVFELWPPDVQIICAQTTQAGFNALHLAGEISAVLVSHAEFTIVGGDVYFVASGL
jgi:hypothetical protein